MSMQGAAGVIETVAGLLIMIGLFTRVAAFLASGEMAVAFWYIHVSVVAMGDKGAGLPLGPHTAHEQRRGRGGVLLRVPLYRHSGRRYLECQLDDGRTRVEAMRSPLKVEPPAP